MCTRSLLKFQGDGNFLLSSMALLLSSKITIPADVSTHYPHINLDLLENISLNLCFADRVRLLINASEVAFHQLPRNVLISLKFMSLAPPYVDTQQSVDI